MVAWPYKVIRKLPYSGSLIYDLEKDPNETKNIGKQLPIEIREQLDGLLDDWMRSLQVGKVVSRHD